MNLKKRILSLLMAGAMLVSATPMNVVLSNVQAETNLCEHHPEHNTEICGYTETEPCNFICPECSVNQQTPPIISSNTVITSFLPLSEEIVQQNVTVGTGIDQLVFPANLEAQDENGNPIVIPVTWNSDLPYDPTLPGTYTFSPVLVGGYSLAENLPFPIITVTVAEDVNPLENNIIEVSSMDELVAAFKTVNESSADKFTISLLNDIDDSQTILEKSSLALEAAELTILGNGHTITFMKEDGNHCGQPAFSLNFWGVLNLGSYGFDENQNQLTIKSTAGYRNESLIMIEGESASLEMYDGVTLTGNKAAGENCGGAVTLADKNAHFNMRGGVITGNESLSGFGGGVSILGGDASLDGEISNNKATNSGSSSGGYGGGVAIRPILGSGYSPNSISIYGEIYQNEAKYGGGIYITEATDYSYMNIYGTIRYNTAEFGAGTYMSNCKDANINAQYSNNEANTGAGVYLSNCSNITMSRIYLSDNKARMGAGMYLMDCANVEMNSASVYSNKGQNGVGMYLHDCSDITIKDSRFNSNTQESLDGSDIIYGGGAVISNSIATLTNCEITDSNQRLDTPVGDGAGLYINNESIVRLDNCEIEHNQAYRAGGIMVNHATVELMEGTTLCNNTATKQGADMSAEDAILVNLVPAHEMNKNYEMDGLDHKITGWYEDGPDNRFDSQREDNKQITRIQNMKGYFDLVAAYEGVNHIDFGGISISKTVSGSQGDQQKDFHFTLTLSDPTINGTCGDLEFTNGVANFTLKHGQRKWASPLPINTTYTVVEQEANTDGYTTTSTGESGTIGEMSSEVSFINTKDGGAIPDPDPDPSDQKGDLAITKTVAGNQGDQQKDFNFTLTLSDSTINGTYGDLEFVNGVANFTLKHGETKSAKDLPIDITYTVVEQEANMDGYTTTSTGESGTIVETVAEVSFINTKDGGAIPDPDPSDQKGDLAITKTVAGNQGDQQKDFNFILTLSDPTINGTYGDLEFVNGAANFTLKHGETKSAKDLPIDVTYTVVEQEANMDGYTTTSTGESGTIVETVAEVSFINTKDDGSIPDPKPDPDPDPQPEPSDKTGNLSVTKIVSGNEGETNRDFTFKVTLSDSSIHGTYGDMVFENGVSTFTLKHQETKTATGLPAGTRYMVEESDCPGYTVTKSNAEGTIDADKTITVMFNNHKGDTQPTPDPGDPDKPNPGQPSNPDPNKPNKPNQPGDPTQPGKPNQPNKETPGTATQTNLALWLVLFEISGVVLILALIANKRRRKLR